MLTDMQPKNAVSSSMHSSFAALLANFGLTLSGCSLAFPIPQSRSPKWAMAHQNSISAAKCPAQTIIHRSLGL